MIIAKARCKGNKYFDYEYTKAKATLFIDTSNRIFQKKL